MKGEGIILWFQPDGFTNQPAIQLLCISSTRWNYLFQRPQQIMSRLAARYATVYVDPPFPVAKEEVPNYAGNSVFDLSPQIETINDNLVVFTPRQVSMNSLPGIAAAPLESLNQQLVIGQIRRFLSMIHWERPLLWIYDPQAVTMVPHLTRSGIIYDCVDSFRTFSWSSPYTDRNDRNLTTLADVVLASSHALYLDRLQLNPNTYFVPNAADFDHFSRCGQYAGDYPDLAGVGRPRLGFTGAIYEWVDLTLLERLATRHPDWNLVLVGPQQHGLKIPVKPNILWLGPRKYEDLPRVLQSFDILLIPFLANETTRYTNPIKLWEYLAAGKTVIAAGSPEIPHYPGITWLSQNHDEFEANCVAALHFIQDTAAKKAVEFGARNIARENCWDAKCEAIHSIIEKHFPH
jgi:UDP-galactopyranose mutase